MPVRGITFARLKEHFRKYLLIYLAVIAGALVMTNILYTTTAPRVPDDQEVLCYMVSILSEAEGLSDLSDGALEAAQAADERCRSVRFETVMYADPETDYTAAMVLMTRMAVGEGDIYFASAEAVDTLLTAEMGLPLDDALADGLFDCEGLQPVKAHHTVYDENGEYVEDAQGEEYVAALTLDGFTALQARTGFPVEGARLFIASNGTNPEASLAAADELMRQLWQESQELAAPAPEPAG